MFYLVEADARIESVEFPGEVSFDGSERLLFWWINFQLAYHGL